MRRESPRRPSDLAVLDSARRALRRCGSGGKLFRPVFTNGDADVIHNRYGFGQVERLVVDGLLAYGNDYRSFAVLTEAGRAAITVDDSSVKGIASK